MSDVTRLLDEMSAGDPAASEQLIALVYSELRRMAAQRMGSDAAGQTLQPTALVHEVWLRTRAWLGVRDQVLKRV